MTNPANTFPTIAGSGSTHPDPAPAFVGDFSDSLREHVESVLLEAAKDEEREPRYGFSDAGSCPRYLVLQHRQFHETGEIVSTSKPLRWVLQAACGHAVASVVEAAARRLGDTSQVAAELPNDAGLPIHGHADWLWTAGDAVIDLKLAGENKWVGGPWGPGAKDVPSVDHSRQVASYSKALGKGRAALVYIRGASLFWKKREIEYAIHVIDAIDERAQATVDAWMTVQRHLDDGTMPGVPATYSPNRFPCAECRFSEDCWPAHMTEAF